LKFKWNTGRLPVATSGKTIERNKGERIMRKALFWEMILSNPIALAIIAVVLVLVGILWFMNERQEQEQAEKDRRNY
jgi:predicted membrane protein